LGLIGHFYLINQISYERVGSQLTFSLNEKFRCKSFLQRGGNRKSWDEMNPARDTQVIDCLELSIIFRAPFYAVFSWNNVNFSKCQNAPFAAYSLGRISYDLHRNKVKSLDQSIHSHWQWKSLSGTARYCMILSWHQVAYLTCFLKRSENIIWNYQGFHNAGFTLGYSG
jgi:hypothetical protein